MRKRVLIVGAGASGVAAAYSLGKSPEKFDVQVWEKAAHPGGVATSQQIEGPGDLYINDGVQGGSQTYRNVLNLMSEFGFSVSPVKVKLSFGRGSTSWTNYTKTELTNKHRNEIKKFGRTLRIINKLEVIFICIPISKVLKMFGHSDEFCYEMVFPLIALFFGTGNQVPSVSAAIVARVFLDDKLRLFDYDSEKLLSQTPELFAFPKLSDVYEIIMSNTGAAFYPNRAVFSVTRRAGKVYAVDECKNRDVFDAIIFACDAETILAVLENPTLIERQVLGNIKYFTDISVTHEDTAYMHKHYELHSNLEHYFIRSDAKDPTKLEMSFYLSNFQPQLKSSDRDIYQTIFLDDTQKHRWTFEEIDKKKIRLIRKWRKFSHSWRHFAFTVPLTRFLQGTMNTWYCGAYTLLGTHEVAVISGFAAASRLGAKYPFPDDDLALTQYQQYLFNIHGKPARYGCNLETVKSVAMTPLMILVLGLVLFILFIMKCLGKNV